jgi:outer membrane protein, heavy metal efflux system
MVRSLWDAMVEASGMTTCQSNRADRRADGLPSGTPIRSLVAALVGSFFFGCTTAPSPSELTGRVLAETRGVPQTDASHEPPGIEGRDRLSEDEAVAVALWNNAAFQESLANLGFQRADLLLAGQLGNPSFVTLFPAGPKQFQFTALLPVEAFWLRPRRVAVAKIDLESASEQLVATGLDLVRNVRIAFVELVLAEDRLKAAAKSVEVQERIAELTRKRFEAGDVGGLESDLAAAVGLQSRQRLERHRRDESLARARLRQLLGLKEGDSIPALVRADIPAGQPIDEAELFRRALAARPELRANELALQAAAKRGQLSKAEAFLVGAAFDVKGTPTGTQAGPGLNLTLPILNQNQGARARAEASSNVLVRRHLALQDRIQLEVREALTRREHALRELEIVRKRILPALESVANHARQSLAAGDVSPGVLLESERSLADGQVLLAEAVAEVHRSEAELLRAVGRRFENP